MASLIHEPQRPRKPWRVSWVERRRHRTRRFATKREAQMFVAEVLRGAAARSAERITLDGWMKHWLLNHGLAWEPRTRHDRASYIDRFISPHLGHLRLGEIGRADVREWRGNLVRGGTTVYVADRAVTVLSAALGAAVDDDLVVLNPCHGLKRLPRPANRRRPALLTEVEAVRRKIGARDARLVISLMAYAGLRPSEVRALRWEDVREHSLVVRAAIREGGGEKGTKTGSIRSIPIIEPLRDDIERLRDELAEARPLGVADTLPAVDAAPTRPVVVVPIPDWRNWTRRVWRPARIRAGTDITPYSLRHTFASLLIAEGRNPWQVAALMGHSTPQMVITCYGHLFAEAELAAPQRMEDAAVAARHAASISRTSATN